jgi:hypothetical protein
VSRVGLAFVAATLIACSGPATHATDAGPDDGGAGAEEDEGDGLAGDAGDDALAPSYAPTFTALYGEILAPSCALLFCHGGADGTFLPMDTQAIAYSAMVGVVSHGPKCGASGLELVNPGDAGASLLYLKVTAPPCGNKMPAEYEPYLDLRQTEQIRMWIAMGASNN